MRIGLGTFLCFAVHAEGGDPTTLISSALVNYRELLDTEEPRLAVPAFYDVPDVVGEVEVPLEPELEGLLRSEAARQGVNLERLLSHAVFLHLAERDRIAARAGSRR